jgi:ATP/maltotriose-dependent transcriptional regulator MalT
MWDLIQPGAPRLPRTYVPRRRLFDQLDRAARSSVVLLVAPAGAGKTLGVAGWLQQEGANARELSDRRDALWVRVDPTWDGERITGLLDLAENSLVTVDHGTAAAPPAGEVGAAPGTPRLVVLDDAHRLPAAALRVIDARLNDAPHSMRLLLLSRWDLPLTRLAPELLGHFTVLRGGVLRMDDHEAAAIITAHAGTSSKEVVEAITDHAQGWCAAAVLTARAVAAAADPVAAARQYSRADAGIADRVASEVFAALTPRERHLLLCTAAEEVVSASTAAMLAREPYAGEILADLATTGLLVTCLGGAAGPGFTGRVEPATPEPEYRIHPLLAEVVRRRLVAGGVDVALARATVVRAVRLDIARGDTSRAFDRLVTMQEPGIAAEVLAGEGVGMVMSGQGPGIAAFARRCADVIEARPATWFPIALERWVAGDVEAARRWMDRILEQCGGTAAYDRTEPADRWSEEAATVACIRLMQARLGLEPMYAAVGHAQHLVLASLGQGRPQATQALLPQLLVELGITQNWLGDLVQAEVNLTAVIGMCRTRNLPALAANATSHLAFTLYMAGKERACVHVATEALGMLGSQPLWRPRFAAHRASLALLLGGLVDPPWPTAPIEPPAEPTPVHAADLCTRFWVRMRDARLALLRGSVAEAERILGTPLDLPVAADQLPDHLQVALLVERAFLAALSSDQQALRQFEDQLTALHALGESALVAGLRADLAGDRRGAASLFDAAAGDVTYSQPATRALALTCQAQLLDSLGEADAALERLREAAVITEVRRNAVPFLGWSRQGTPIETLLGGLASRTTTPANGPDWVHELAAALAGKPDIAALLAPTTATPQERSTAGPTMVRPLLSPREREVLNELARGATYADIAANLFVSENTVKTHVSSLYGKLAVSRRSEALAVARNLHLL